MPTPFDRSHQHRLRQTVACLMTLFIVTLYPGGCAAPQVSLTLVHQSSNPAQLIYDDRPFATVLRENVRDGLVDYDHLTAHRKPLDAYLDTIARTGPQSTPQFFKTRNHRISFYINAYNAAVLAAVLDANVPQTMHSHLTSAMERRYRIALDGRIRTIEQVRRLAEEESRGDARVLLCLCDAARGSSPLGDQPLRPIGLEETLRVVAQKAMDDPRIVRVDHERQRLLVSITLWTRSEVFKRYYRARTGAKDASMLNVVLHLAGGVRRQWLNTAVGYVEGAIPFDRTLNRWTPPTTPQNTEPRP